MSDTDSNEEMPYGDMGMPGMPEPTPEEHLWIGNLSGENGVIKFEGCDDAECNLILKRANLDAECEDESRHVIQIISLDHDDQRISGTLCNLNLNNHPSVSLDSLVVSPPTAFKLVKGKGPITITANLMKEVDSSLMEEDDEDLEAMADRINGEVDSDEEEDGPKIEEMETSSEEEPEKESAKKPSPAQNKKQNDKKKPEAQKRKNEDAKNENKKDNKKAKTDIKAKVEASKDKPAKAPIKNVADLLNVIKQTKGGRPSKKGKFCNWVKHQFKVEDSEMVEAAWNKLQASK